MLAENFVVKGVFFKVKSSKEDYPTLLENLKGMLLENLRSKGYLYAGPDSFSYNFLEMKFDTIIPREISLLQKIPFFREKSGDSYFKQLDKTRQDMPWCLRVYIYPGNFKEKEGLFIEIISEPAIFYKIVQRNPSLFVDEKQYSFIVYTNKEFVDGIAKSLLCSYVKDARPLGEYVKTEVSEKLKSFKFDKIATLLETGRKKIELGNSDGLVDLRAAIEQFLVELITRLGGKPHSLDKPESNIQLLEKTGYLDGVTKGLLVKVLFNGVYVHLSDGSIHNRKEVNLFDARLLFNLNDQVFDYLLEKILRYKIRHIPAYNHDHSKENTHPETGAE